MHDACDAILSYLVAFLSFLTNLDMMHVGAIILLSARLLVDVPRAYIYLKGLKNGDSSKGPI